LSTYVLLLQNYKQNVTSNPDKVIFVIN
jgi:hypothetical protein